MGEESIVPQGEVEQDEARIKYGKNDGRGWGPGWSDLDGVLTDIPKREDSVPYPISRPL
jgi:hypothetical protein